MQTQFSEYQRRETSLQLTIELFTRQITQQRRTQRKNNHEPFNGREVKVGRWRLFSAWQQGYKLDMFRMVLSIMQNSSISTYHVWRV